MKPQIKRMNTDKENLLNPLLEDDCPSENYELNRLSEVIIGCAFKVGNTLGCGFLEKVYENALAFELRNAGLIVVQQEKIAVIYQNVIRRLRS